MSIEMAYGGYIPESKPLEESIGKADVIAFAVIKSVAPDPQAATTPSMARPVRDMRGIVEATALQPAGDYEFELIGTVKGLPPKELKLRLPMVSGFYYDQAKFAVNHGMKCILILKNGKDGYSPVDDTLPLIPLSAAASLTDFHDDSKNVVIKLIKMSLNDVNLRRALTHLLRDMSGKAVMNAIARYKQDPDAHTRASSLECLAFNQDTNAIPLIVAVGKKNPDEDYAALAFQYYREPGAVPLLNAALDDGAYYTRLNAACALNRIGDQTSIPFLMRAAACSDEVVAWQAYCSLHRIGGESAGTHLGPEAFWAHCAEEIDKLKTWLHDHPTALNAP